MTSRCRSWVQVWPKPTPPGSLSGRGKCLDRLPFAGVAFVLNAFARMEFDSEQNWLGTRRRKVTAIEIVAPLGATTEETSTTVTATLARIDLPNLAGFQRTGWEV